MLKSKNELTSSVTDSCTSRTPTLLIFKTEEKGKVPLTAFFAKLMNIPHDIVCDWRTLGDSHRQTLEGLATATAQSFIRLLCVPY